MRIGWSDAAGGGERETPLGPLGRAVDPQRYHVAFPQGAPCKPAEPGAHIGRRTAEHGGHRDPALDREVGAHRFPPEDDPKNLAAGQRQAVPGGHDPLLLADRQARAGAGDRHPHPVGGDFEGGSADQDLERRHPRRVADQRVAEPQCGAIERA